MVGKANISLTKKDSIRKCHHSLLSSTPNEDKTKVASCHSNINSIRQKLRRHILSMTQNIPYIDEPSSNDVLCLHSMTSRCHVGTILFYRLVDANIDIYRNCNSAQKLLLAQSIVDALDTRFLRKQERGGEWYDIGHKAAIQYTLITLEKYRQENDLSRRK
jgi:hypothetical protein